MKTVSAFLSNDSILFRTEDDCLIHEYNQALLNNNQLTDKEYSVFSLINASSTHQGVADILKIKLSTVKKHLTSIYLKMKVKNKIELILLKERFENDN